MNDRRVVNSSVFTQHLPEEWSEILRRTSEKLCVEIAYESVPFDQFVERTQEVETWMEEAYPNDQVFWGRSGVDSKNNKMIIQWLVKDVSMGVHFKMRWG